MFLHNLSIICTTHMPDPSIELGLGRHLAFSLLPFSLLHMHVIDCSIFIISVIVNACQWIRYASRHPLMFVCPCLVCFVYLACTEVSFYCQKLIFSSVYVSSQNSIWYQAHFYKVFYMSHTQMWTQTFVPSSYVTVLLSCVVLEAKVTQGLHHRTLALFHTEHCSYPPI